jgi:hypothetical protein
MPEKEMYDMGYYPIGKRRGIGVTHFKNAVYICIQEFNYKPDIKKWYHGKGINLTVKEWKTLQNWQEQIAERSDVMEEDCTRTKDARSIPPEKRLNRLHK